MGVPAGDVEAYEEYGTRQALRLLLDINLNKL
jgi:hypothetical protein